MLRLYYIGLEVLQSAAAGYGIWYFIRCNKFFGDKVHLEWGKWELGMVFLAALVVKFFVS